MSRYTFKVREVTNNDDDIAYVVVRQERGFSLERFFSDPRLENRWLEFRYAKVYTRLRKAERVCSRAERFQSEKEDRVWRLTE